MAVPCARLALLLCLMILPATVASPRSLRRSRANTSASRPTTFFEVDRPLRPPRGSSGRCSTLLLSASFGSTFANPPAAAAYSPPRCLVRAGGRASAISLAVLEWRAACRGAQLGRIFGVWLGGAEILRGSTAAPPPPNGVVWSVSKDVTKYASLLAAAGKSSSTLTVYLGNLVNTTLTGVYHANVTLTLHLYLRRTSPTVKLPPAATAPADLIVPMSRAPPPLSGGRWFSIRSAADLASASVALPPNTYRAVLELYVSSHEDDELWYTKQPGYQNGPFREVTARVDGVLAGAMCPFPVIYAGGIYPLLWRPITPIGSFNLPTYDIELTPFLGKLLDGKPHEFALAVTNAVGVWYVDANLHLWLDPGSTATAAGLVSYVAPPANTTSSKSADPVDTHYHATANRLVSATGWVRSSYGKIMTNATRAFAFEYLLTFETLDLTVVADTCVVATDHAGVVLYSAQTHGNFPLGWVYQQNSLAVTHGLEETTVATGRWSPGPPYRSLRTTQSSLVEDEEGGGKSWGVRQTYWYKATDGCYFRNVTSSNYSVVSDHSNEVCVKGTASAPLPPL